MRIAVCQRMCPEYIVPLFQRLSRRYEIDFIFSRFGQDQAFFFDPERITGIRALGLRPLPFPLLPFRSRVLNKLAFWAHLLVLAAQLARALGRGRYDIVVGGDFGRFECVVACLWARCRRRTFLLWSDAWHWPVTRRDRLRLPLVRWMVRSATALIAGGSQAAHKLVDLGAGTRPIFNVYHTNVSVALGERSPERFVLYVGRLDERKGVEHLLRAFARLGSGRGDVRLTIVGLGAREQALRDLARELGIAPAVDFAGWVDHKEIGDYYRRCAVFVLPSIFTADGGYEPFSNVVLEAMAWGAPVITTLANGAAYDVLEDGVNGRVVADREPEALAAALRDLLADPPKAEAMGRRGRETVRTRFNVDRMAERFSEALDYALGTASRSRA
jgi:glycosyltransferase involved in cell wall biosynthesis